MYNNYYAKCYFSDGDKDSESCNLNVIWTKKNSGNFCGSKPKY